MAGVGVREVARRAVQAEIAAVAERLFREEGYDAVTVDRIAEQVGMSQRTFFRHVGTKEDLVMADFIAQGEQVLALLAARPAHENAWVSLRAAFEVYITLHHDPAARDRARLMRSIVASSPTLRAAYLDRMDTVQRQLADVLAARTKTSTTTQGESCAEDGTGVMPGTAATGLSRPALRGVVGAAFAALYAATEGCDQDCDQDGKVLSDFPAVLDEVMASLQPRVLID
ncbi:AcrR family transcriptional regulator [Kineococcus radiotolerans]|uniref:AcrR family transcriptional regulator n=1 Tax=Kineococcus radiotolerans TaxID=131568 RepID=A0A7W4TQU5_KINRA|nr:TetR/AcrR family transcriptional regulator [Kineococcus radiotolerans]MBB2903404.1 AcrR family transcriptional regulator [Kineococcus radiotolerans]